MRSTSTRWRTLTRRLITLAAVPLPAVVLALAGTYAQADTRGVSGTGAARHDSYHLPAGVTNPCTAARPGHATCAALAGAPGGLRHHRAGPGRATAAATPAGYAPADLRSAYDLPSSSSLGTGETVAVVTAYDDPNAESDLGSYRSQYGIAACTTANGCFKKVNQTGGTTYPATAAGWSVPAAQSMDMISAVCPACHILLVEANSSDITDVGTAENEAVSLGAGFVDNDWFASEIGLGASETSYDSQYFNHPGIAITAPSGNTGYAGGVSYPAASPYVTAVGGTTLTKSTGTGRGWTETAWSGTGSGCSAYEPKPAWQSDTGCSDRTLNDAAADADPNTPIAYYDTPTEGGWTESGGTAMATAIVTAEYALAGPPAPGTVPASYLYDHPGALNAITSGSAGSCSPSYLCTAGAGYNGPAGMGTAAGVAAFGTTGAKPAAVTAPNGTSWAFVRATDGSIEADSLPSGSTAWSGLTSLGGNFPAYPAALAGSGGYIWVAGVAGGNLSIDDLPNGSATWSGWTSLGNPGSALTGIPAIAQDASGTIHVFARAASGALYTTTLPQGSNTWSGFSSLGGTWPGNAAAIAGSGGYLFVFEVGTTHNLYDDELPPGSSWSGWNNLGGSTVGVPAAIQDNSTATLGTIRVFVRSTAGQMEEDSVPFHSTTWTGLAGRGGTWQDDPAAFSSGGGTDWLYAVGSTKNLYYDKLTGGASNWSGWTGLGGAFTGVPGATQNSSANELFGRTTGGSLGESHITNGTSTWSTFANLGGPAAGS
jgi:hypothetical protein